jgi:thiamine-phosphate pyrophosphorylase
LKNRAISGIYAITPDCSDTGRLVRMVEQGLLGGIKLVQYRNKVAVPQLRALQAGELAVLCNRFDATFIVNDDADLALRVNADGVHVGRHDGSLAHARQMLGAGKIVGVSCYDDLELARRAVDDGADYLAFGSVFPSSVKPEAVRAPLSLFEEARRIWNLPLVAIGGISVTNGMEVIARGADALATISAIFAVEDASIEEAARSMCKLFGARQPRT